MAKVTVEDEQEHLGHFYDSPRHRMQVDFNTYVADLAKEIAAGKERAADRVAVLTTVGRSDREDSVVVVTGVDPVTFRFSGGRSAD